MNYIIKYIIISETFAKLQLSRLRISFFKKKVSKTYTFIHAFQTLTIPISKIINKLEFNFEFTLEFNFKNQIYRRLKSYDQSKITTPEHSETSAIQLN